MLTSEQVLIMKIDFFTFEPFRKTIVVVIGMTRAARPIRSICIICLYVIMYTETQI